MEIRLQASPARRVVAVGVLYALGGLSVYSALNGQVALPWSLLTMGLGVLAVLAGEALRRATALSLVLDHEGLRDSSGQVLALWDDIAAIDRGSFSIKPSNGFTLRLKRPGSRVWKPGLWWRLGRRIGVGGVTGAQPTKVMAEAIDIRIAKRDGLLGR